MQAGVSLLVSGVMPIYMIIPRYSHNYAQFGQLLNSNFFTHRNIICSWEKPLVKPMAPRSIFHHINLPSTSYFLFHLFCFLYFASLSWNTKNLILSYLWDLTFVSDREGIDNPFIVLVARFLFVCACTRWFARSLLLDWYLGSQKLREILTLLCCITLSSSRENQCSTQEVAKNSPQSSRVGSMPR